jgi:ATP-binding cassette subfamily F protein 3
MDEPTTHLDMASIDALIGALQQFQGTVVFISHDVYFIRALANQVVHVKGGRLQRYTGGYSYYLERTKPVSERAGLTAGEGQNAARPKSQEPRTSVDRKEQKRREAEQRQNRSKAARAQHQAVRDLEKKVNVLEVRQAELAAELENPETYAGGRANHVNRELMEVVAALEATTAEWEAAATKLAETEAAEAAAT